MKHRLAPFVLVFCLGAFAESSAAPQDDRTDLPAWLARGTVDVAIGEIRYPFSARHLEDGFTAEAVDAPGLAARLSLGHQLTRRLTVNLTYLRPARWVQYRNINGDHAAHSVWTNVVGASLKQRVPLGRVSLYGEGGLGVVTRHGVEIRNATAIEDLVYATPLIGAGAEVPLNNAWTFNMGATFLPGRGLHEHPYTMLFASGIGYRMRPRPAPAAPRPASDPSAIFPEHLVQFGLATSALGTGLGTVVSPVFWEGDAVVQSGGAIDYQRNVFHTRRLFSLDLGASLAYGHSRVRGDDFMTFSLFPLMRFTPVRTGPADVYVSYSVAGPTLISKFIIDGHETGRHFTFRDAIGIGTYVGAGRRLNAEVRIVHYSNGNLLPRNSGIQVPMMLTLGYAF